MESQQFNKIILKGKLSSFAKTYLFYGQTAFLSEENAQNLVLSANKNGFTQREIFYIDNKTKFQNLISSIQSPSLFDPKKIIEIRLDTDKPTKKIGEKLANIAKHQSDNLLIIQANNISYKQQKEKWFTDIIKYSEAVISKPIYQNQLPNWIYQRSKQLNISLSSDALKIIMDFSQGNILWTNQILMQLSQSDYPQPIKEKVIKEILDDMSIFNVEDFNKSILNKKVSAIKIIQKLEKENESLIYITSILYRNFELLYKIINSKKSFNQTCQDLKIWQNKQNNYQAATNHYDIIKISNTLKKLATLDRINKGQNKGNGWVLLNNIVSDLVL